MEPTKFDQLIQEKLSQENDLHSNEIAKSQAFVWTAVQQELESKPILFKWYHLAAAIILLLIGSSFLFVHMQNRHSTELNRLAQQMNALQATYISKSNTNTNTNLIKEEQLEQLQNELKQLKSNMANVTFKADAKIIEPQLLVKRDTVFIKQIEYVTQYVPIETKQADSTSKEKNIQKEKEDIPSEKDWEIYPNYERVKPQNMQQASIKVKLSTFASN